MPSAQLIPDTAIAARPPAGRVLLIVNDGAARVSSSSREEVVSALSEWHSVDAVSTRSPAEAIELCRVAAADGHDLVVTFGGDGTVRAAARGLIGSETALACIPGGFTNVFARTLGVPLDPPAAAAHIAELRRRQAVRSVALGTANGRPFLFVAGVGFSAALMERLEAASNANGGFGSAYAAWQAAAVTARMMAGHAPRLTIEVDGDSTEVIGAIAQNSDPLTYFRGHPIRVCPAAPLGPEGFSVATLRSARVRDVARLAYGAFTGNDRTAPRHPRMGCWTGIREARLTSLDPAGMPLEIDGDYMGRHDVIELGVAPEKLLVLA
jgi:diacylglycerol kinase family enzyme